MNKISIVCPGDIMKQLVVMGLMYEASCATTVKLC